MSGKIDILKKSQEKSYTSSNQRLGECVRPKMDSQVVAKEQDCRLYCCVRISS